MTANENSSFNRNRYSLPQNFSDEEMVRDWTLSESDKQEVGKYRRLFRPIIAVQLCAIRLYGRFLSEANDLSPRIINYLNGQLGLPPSLVVKVPNREATYIKHRRNILSYLGFRKFDEEATARCSHGFYTQRIAPSIKRQEREHQPQCLGTGAGSGYQGCAEIRRSLLAEKQTACFFLGFDIERIILERNERDFLC